MMDDEVEDNLKTGQRNWHRVARDRTVCGSPGSQWAVVPEEDEEEHCSYC
jgi:hypothetical protein